jgi:hypothetical protein
MVKTEILALVPNSPVLVRIFDQLPQNLVFLRCGENDPNFPKSVHSSLADVIMSSFGPKCEIWYFSVVPALHY